MYIIINKVTYRTSNLFSLKKYENSNLNCQSYEYPTIYAIRSAILGVVIQLENIEFAKEIFHKIKNAVIFVQYPKRFSINGCRIKRFANSYYNLKEKDKLEREKLLENNFSTSIGFREYVHLEEIVFYIDKSIPNIITYLKNIDWLGTAESMVYLESIEETVKLDRVMIQDNMEKKRKYEQYDWDSKAKFENVYMYSLKYDKRKQKKLMCTIRDMVL